MKKYLSKNNVLLFATILVCIGTIISYFSSFTDSSYRIFFGSDQLYLPSIYKDIFIDHNTLKGWHLNPAPNIFPDMIVYFLIMAVTSNFIVASFVYAIIQYLFFIYLIFRLLNAIDLPEPKLITALSNLLMLLFFMVSFYSNDFNFTFYLVSNAFHMSAFLMALLCTILSIEYLKNKGSNHLIYICIISILSVVSDKLFIVSYSVPWIFLTIIIILKSDQQNRRKFLTISLVNIICATLGIIIFNLIKNTNYIQIGSSRMMEFKFIKESLNILSMQMWNYLTDLNFKTLIIVISIIVFIFLSIISLKKILNKKILNILELYYLLSIIFTILVFIAPVINGNYTGFDTLRYNIYVFYLLIINSGILIYFLIKKIYSKFIKLLNGIIIIVLIAGAINTIYQFKYKGLKYYFNYYPKEAEEVDKIADTEKLYCGLGDYWKAKVITMFSKKGVRVYTALGATYPWYHVMNENWFKNGRFNFIISEDKAQDSIINNYFNKKTRAIKSGDIKLIFTPEYKINTNENKIEY
jgi:hypothetical protein